MSAHPPSDRPHWTELLGNPDVYLDGEYAAVEALRAWVGAAPATAASEMVICNPEGWVGSGDGRFRCTGSHHIGPGQLIRCVSSYHRLSPEDRP